MSHPATVGVFEPAHRLMDQVDGAGCVDRPADLHEFPQRLPLDELHGEVTRPVLLTDIFDGDDVGMPEQPPHLTFVLEGAALVGVVRESVAEHLHRQHGAGVAVDGAIHPRERSRPDLVEDLRLAEEVASAFAAEETFELEAGEQLPADERLTEGRRVEGMPSGL